MKKFTGLLVTGLLLGSMFLSSCDTAEKKDNDNKTSETEQMGDAAPDVGNAKVGILQLVTHDALDNSRMGFLNALADRGYKDGENLEVVYLNAENDQSTLKTMSQQIVSDKCDLALAIATPSAVTLATDAKDTDMPIVITAVTDPVDAKLMTDAEKPGGNITGTSDLTPVRGQLELLVQILPDIKKIGIIYSSSESNSKFQSDLATEVCGDLGIEVIVKTITSTNDIGQVAESLVNEVDAIYVPTDNMVASAMPTLTGVTNQAKIPVVAGERSMTEKGALCSVSINYLDLGYKTGEMAADILEGKSKPADMAIEYAPNPTRIFNKKAFTTLGIPYPEDMVQDTDEVFE